MNVAQVSNLPSGVSFRVEVIAKTRAALIEQLAAVLREEGYSVTSANAPWEKLAAFCRRVGIQPHHFNDIVMRYSLRSGPLPRMDRRGKTGRLAALQSNPQFDNFCRSLRRQKSAISHQKSAIQP